MTNFSAAYGVGGAAVKSVQRGTMAFVSNAQVATATITTVTNTAKTVCSNCGIQNPNGPASGWGGDTVSIGAQFAALSLQDASTVRAQQGGNANSGALLNVSWEVTEFN